MPWQFSNVTFLGLWFPDTFEYVQGDLSQGTHSLGRWVTNWNQLDHFQTTSWGGEECWNTPHTFSKRPQLGNSFLMLFDSFMTWKCSQRSSNPLFYFFNQMEKTKGWSISTQSDLAIPESSSSYPNLHLQTFLVDFFVEVAPRFRSTQVLKVPNQKIL